MAPALWLSPSPRKEELNEKLNRLARRCNQNPQGRESVPTLTAQTDCGVFMVFCSQSQPSAQVFPRRSRA